MPSIEVKITNLPQIRAAFSKSPALMVRELNTAIKKSIFAIGRQSRVNTPVATGRLRSSTLEKFANLMGEVGTHTNYDIYVHQGTRFMNARPYLLNAVKSNEREVGDNFTKAVQNVLDEIARGM